MISMDFAGQLVAGRTWELDIGCWILDILLVKSQHLPATKEQMAALGWDRPDVVIVTGDAHVDHPSFPAAILGRTLEAEGFKVCIISRPDVRNPQAIAEFGLPRLFFGVTAGALDSMVANYTPLRKRRSDDPYAPDGIAGGRPDRAVTVYCNMIRKVFGKSAFIVAGGLEASLRKFAHYDFWSDSVRRPLLMDCGANIIVHGMGEGPVGEIAKRIRDFSQRGKGEGQSGKRQEQRVEDLAGLEGGNPLPPAARKPEDVKNPSQNSYGQRTQRIASLQNSRKTECPSLGGTRFVASAPVLRQSQKHCPPEERIAEALRDIPGVVFRVGKREAEPQGGVGLPSAEEVAAGSIAHMTAYKLHEENRDKVMWQNCGGMRVIANPVWTPTSKELDRVYSLPFTREAHPMYKGAKIPALETVRFSVTSHRGCFGGCAFCAIGAHQGKTVVSRSKASILEEIKGITKHEKFRGTITDLGGPTANMYGAECKAPKRCKRASCLWPEQCGKLNADQIPYLELLKAAKKVPGVKHLFVSTGIRMDLALSCEPFLYALAFEHTSGHLKVAPEHISPKVLNLMRKPVKNDFNAFLRKHRELSKKAGKEQYVLPYFIAAHPGCTVDDMIELAEFLKREKIVVEQCQIFTPTPGTLSTAMYATGLDPATLEPVYVEKKPRRKEMQKALILYHLPESQRLISEAMRESMP
jgi:radical SAM superfamily enzyme YgiQ (UPF0313 family)